MAGAGRCGGSVGVPGLGLPDRNLPLEEARHREFRYPAYQPAADNAPVAHGRPALDPSLPVETIPSQLLVPVGNAKGTQLYALRGAARRTAGCTRRRGTGPLGALPAAELSGARIPRPAARPRRPRFPPGDGPA
jgi:hypothetical protein